MTGGGLTYGDLYAKQSMKERRLMNAGYNVVSKWTCEIEKEIEADKDMKLFFDEWKTIEHPIRSSREAYYGGRVETNVLLMEFAPEDIEMGYEMKYMDICM